MLILTREIESMYSLHCKKCRLLATKRLLENMLKLIPKYVYDLFRDKNVQHLEPQLLIDVQSKLCISHKN